MAEQITEDKKKITPNEAIVLMVDAINRSRPDQFYKAAEDYRKGMAMSSDMGHRIGRLLKQRPLQMTNINNLYSDMKKLINQEVLGDAHVFMNAAVLQVISDLKKEWNHRDGLRYHNINPRNKVLLHGLTGNGKTTIAKHISKEMNLPFIEVNSDTLIDSHLGSTGGNIYKVFDSIKEPCVLFWDEIDVIGRKRGKGTNSAEIENDRMVNSMLVNFEKMGSDVVFVAATNRFDILDSAFLRRFDIIHEIPAPTIEEKEAFVAGLVSFYKMEELIGDIAFDWADYHSLSDIKRKFMEIARSFIISKI